MKLAEKQGTIIVEDHDIALLHYHVSKILKASGLNSELLERLETESAYPFEFRPDEADIAILGIALGQAEASVTQALSSPYPAEERDPDCVQMFLNEAVTVAKMRSTFDGLLTQAA